MFCENVLGLVFGFLRHQTMGTIPKPKRAHASALPWAAETVRIRVFLKAVAAVAEGAAIASNFADTATAVVLSDWRFHCMGGIEGRPRSCGSAAQWRAFLAGCAQRGPALFRCHRTRRSRFRLMAVTLLPVVTPRTRPPPACLSTTPAPATLWTTSSHWVGAASAAL